jgi:putative hydrolase of the HAD superfamily
MAGLMRHHGVDPEAFLVDAHDIALDRLSIDARLRAGLERLPGRRLIFTNADADYAARVLAARGIADLFDGICDIRVTRYTPKPDPEAYSAMIAHLGVDPAKSLFVEDMARNLTPAKALGMTTVWLDNGSESGHRDHLPGHVDFHATDIADWLDDLPLPWGLS